MTLFFERRDVVLGYQACRAFFFHSSESLHGESPHVSSISRKVRSLLSKLRFLEDVANGTSTLRPVYGSSRVGERRLDRDRSRFPFFFGILPCRPPSSVLFSSARRDEGTFSPFLSTRNEFCQSNSCEEYVMRTSVIQESTILLQLFIINSIYIRIEFAICNCIHFLNAAFFLH